MTTVVIGIGNSDNKLTQLKWSEFASKMDSMLQATADSIHFAGFSLPNAAWQNACWVVEVSDDWVLRDIKRGCANLAEEYRQESVAMVIGETQFITPIKENDA